MLLSESFDVNNYDEVMELFYKKGWTDGLPVVPPTEEKVVKFLQYAKLEPGQIIGEVKERDRSITAEKVAINAIMAGCKEEYMPVLVAAVEAICEPSFHFNHLASIGSPTPIMLISGPIVKELQFNYGKWVMGPGARANGTIGRALSLILWNCAELRLDSVLGGTYGNPMRWTCCCIAENPDTPGWESLREYLGFSPQSSTVTVCSSWGGFTSTWAKKESAEDTLHNVSDIIATGGGNFGRGVYLVLVAPPQLERFVKQGWTRKDMRNWLFENTGRTVAELKKRGRWGFHSSVTNYGGAKEAINDSDHDTFVHLFKDNGKDIDQHLYDVSDVTREVDIYFIATGGEVSSHILTISTYSQATSPVTKEIKRV